MASILEEGKNFVNSSIDLVAPHARRDPFNPMAYVKDVNEWFVPAAQMALDEANGEESYPGWAYALASTPFIGKVAKPLAKASRKAGDATKPLMDAIGRLGKTSNQKYITRYHNTKADRLHSIFNDGLSTQYSREGWGEMIPDEQVQDVVFTSSNGKYYKPSGSQVELEIKIPKEDYRNLKRVDYNLEIGKDVDGRNYRIGSFSRGIVPVQHHGRTDIFADDLKPEWITGVKVDGKKMSRKEFEDAVNCDLYDEACLEFLDRLGLVGTDRKTGEVFNKFKLDDF